jgi:ketosteroid isomerase-like protein
MKKLILLICLVSSLIGCKTTAMRNDLQEQVVATEKAFAKTMADRDIVAFGNFISDEAVFFSGEKAIRGRSNIIGEWTPLFNSKSASFSWSPAHVEVLDSGELALSTGPVIAADGRLIATFTSIWRHESSGRWKIIFDKGCDVCTKCATAQ